MPVLASKLVGPAPRAPLVARPRLATMLDVATTRPLTVVTAPAGWGKTTLLSEWARDTRRGPTAWMTIEPGDDSDSLWTHLHASLSAAGAIGGYGRRPVPVPLSVSRRVYLCELATVLADSPVPVRIVLDDLHHLADPDASRDLDFLLRHAEALRLVVAARTEPSLALHRWRLGGELTEIGADDLAFTVAETADALAQHGVDLPAPDVDALRVHTEGWPAGIRLMTRVMCGQADPVQLVDRLTGDQPAIAEYLDREVLACQSPYERDFLLATSVSPRLHGSLADALTGGTDGERILGEFVRRGAFTVEIPGEPGWYRYHPLFAALLRSRLRRASPDRFSELHGRAADWFASHGRSGAALDQALAGRDWHRATAVLFGHWHRIATCPDGPGTGGAAPPPEDVLHAAPELALAYAAHLLSVQDGIGAETFLRLAGAGLNRHRADRGSPARTVYTVLRLALARQEANPAAVEAIARRLLVDVNSGHADHNVRVRAIARTALGAAQLAAGDRGAAERNLVAGAHVADRAFLPCARHACSARLAVLWAGRGELGHAERVAQEVLRAPTCTGRCGADRRAAAYLALATVSFERDRLVDADRYLDLAANQPQHDPFVAAGVATTRIAVHHARADLAAAYDTLRAARRDREAIATAYLRERLTVAEAELRIGCGDTAMARALLQPMLDAVREPPPDLAVILARSYLYDGDHRAAARALPQWADTGAGPLALRLDAGLLAALAAHRGADPRRAGDILERTLELAEPEGFRRPFTRGGQRVRRLLANHLDAGTARWSWVRDLVETGAERAAAAARAPSLVESLTDRELTVLRYLQGTMANSEIAGDLSVSVNTVKTHVRNIYRKLAVTGRRAAVRRARELTLL
ncbi:LuxR C-terminal-related transcriptional regulator [Virgisporangium aliadipatigenens]|nr:LuxR C-terminal-related transcriptional regulator [Virgisporangium aliadipatigenens]